MKTPAYRALTETIRVDLPAPHDGCYVLVIPNPDEAPAYRDFYVVTPNSPGDYMFGCNIEDNEQAAELALSNAQDYITLHA